MPAFDAEFGMPIWWELLSSSPRRSTHFYTQVLGWSISPHARHEDYLIARAGGLPVAGIVAQPADAAGPDTWVTYFRARDISRDLRRVEELGGRVLSGPHRVAMGTSAVVADPAGALCGLLQPAGPEHFVAAGEPGTPVWHELTATTNFEAAGDFYHFLFDWMIAQADGYATAVAGGAAFAGLRDASGTGAQVPSFWQSFVGVADLAAAAAAVPGLGGEVLASPQDTPFGRLAAVADSTGAVVTLCEVAPYTDPDPQADAGAEGQDILGLLDQD